MITGLCDTLLQSTGPTTVRAPVSDPRNSLFKNKEVRLGVSFPSSFRMIVIADDYALADLSLWREQFIPRAFFWVDQPPKVGGLGLTAHREAKTRAPVWFIVAPTLRLDLLPPQCRRTNKGAPWTTFPSSPRAARALEAQCWSISGCRSPGCWDRPSERFSLLNFWAPT